MRRFNTRILIILILFISIGFAYLTRDLSLSGISNIFRNTWDIHFENVQVKTGSVPANIPVISNNDTSVTFYAELEEPGDYYEFTVDAVNGGTIDGMINTFTSIELNQSIAPLVEYTITYEDGEALAQYQELNAGDSCVYKVRLYYKLDIDEDDLPDEAISFDLTFTVDYIQADTNRIRRREESSVYKVLKNEAKSNGLAKKYTGTHQDSMNASLSTKDIYHWYATDDTNGTEIQNKNNVIFANHCWQIIRTTDTGGTKLIYNGEVENNQCLNTRGNHVGYSKVVLTTLSDTYYYGTDYTYDKTNNNFTISGTITTGEIKIGQYTCKKTTASSTCTTLYLVDEVNSGSQYRVIPLKETTNYSQFGALQYNVQKKAAGTIATVNYMYKNSHLYTALGASGGGFYDSQKLTETSTYYYADNISYSQSQYTLENPTSGVYSDISSSLAGKYMCVTADTSSCYYAYYVVYTYENYIYGFSLVAGRLLNDANYNLVFGTGYTDNNDDTYTLTNTTTIRRIDWVNQYSSIDSNYYYCIDYNSNHTSTCTIGVYRVASTDNQGTIEVPSTFNYIYANSFTYNNSTNMYKLDPINRVQFWDTIDPNNRALWNNNHYFCTSSGREDECSSLYYILYSEGHLPRYMKVENGDSVQDVLNDMLYVQDVNTYDSTIKIGLDAWYKKYLSNYGAYIEDTIYCSDRTISNYGAWNPNGGELGSKLVFGTIGSSNLSCPNELDAFSTSNNKAKLSYPVGLLTYQEAYLLNNNNVRVNNGVYWLSNPQSSETETNDTYNRVVGSNGRINTISSTGSANGVRPVISLKSDVIYSSGDGSMANPYVINTN